MSINRVILVGSLGQDPKIGQTQGGLKYSSFSLATIKKWKDKAGEKKLETAWHNISCFGSIVNACEYIGKGSKIYLEGEIKYEEYSDKETGQLKKITKIICDKIDIIQGKDRNNNLNNLTKIEENSEIINCEYDSIPF
jgi:single-strand DNA-binding protein